MNVVNVLGRRAPLAIAVTAVALLAVAACGNGEPKEAAGDLVVYSGRAKSLVEPAFEAFTKKTGIKVGVRYGDSAELAATVLEERGKSPADVVFMQDAGSLGALAEAGLLAPIPDKLLQRVDKKFRSPKSEWVGISGRARTVVYNTQQISPGRDLPSSILGFTDPKWKGRIGWAPTNGSFQAFVTALRVQLGEDRAAEWLRGIKANSPKAYPRNAPIVEAVAAGEIAVGLVNHYYLHEFLAQRGEGFAARNHYYANKDIGALVNVAGVGILKSGKKRAAAERFIDYLLGEEAQRYFAEKTFEFPLVKGVPSPKGVPALEALNPPDIDLSSLKDLRGTLELLRKTGVLS